MPTKEKEAPGTVEFKLKVQGSGRDGGFNVISFHIDRTVNKIPFADIFIPDGDVSEQKYPESNSGDFVPGNTVTLFAGDPDSQKEIFKGIIVSQKIRLNEKGTSLQIKVKDVAVRMTVGRKNAYFYEKDDTAILTEILETYNGKDVKFDIESAEVEATHPEMVQYNCTDWDFVVSRAEATGRIVICENGTVIIKTPELELSEDNFEVVFGENVYHFDAEMDGRDEYSEVIANSYDYSTRDLATKEVFSVKNFTNEGNILPDTLAADVIDLDKFLLQHGGNLEPLELESWATSKMLRSRLAKIRGTARVMGNADLKPGDNINITRFSHRFNGAAYVSGVRHELSGNSSWYTDIQFGYSQEWFAEKHNDIMSRPAAGLLPAISGLMIGLVTAIASGEDPKKIHRVRVKMPLVNNESEGVWARVATLDAGDKHGVFFRPEVGDEVVLGFLDDDPRQPIVLGSLFGGEKADPAVEIKDKDSNFQKTIFTKSGLKLVFDDEKETILISTIKDKNKILIAAKDEKSITIEDESSNKIVMNKDGILIQSSKDIILKADQGDVKINGKNIESKASLKLTAEGTSGAEFKSNGSTVVKGSIIQIN